MVNNSINTNKTKVFASHLNALNIRKKNTLESRSSLAADRQKEKEKKRTIKGYGSAARSSLETDT